MTASTDPDGPTTSRGVSRAAIVIAAFWAIAVVPATVLPMTDPDTFWHIRAGEEILERGAIPGIDEWSIVGAGRPWTSQDWLSNVTMAIGHQAGELGPTLLSILYGLMATASVAILWAAIAIRRVGAGWLSRVAWLLFGLVLAAPVLGVRVQVVDLLLASAVLWVLWHYLATRRTVDLVALPALAAIWVNLHAGFPLLFLLGGAVLVGETIDRLLGRRAQGDPLEWSQQAWLFVALVISTAALVLNPNGVRIYAYPFETLGISALAGFVGEWQAASLDAPAGQLLAAFVLLAIVPSLALGWRIMRSADALIMLGLVFMAATAVRFLLVAGPICAAIVCVVLAARLAQTKPGAAMARLIARWTQREQGMRGTLNGTLTVVVIAVGLILVGWRIAPSAQAAAVAQEYPVDAVRWLGAGSEERVFNRYEWGGYLGLQLPERPVFIDGRADVYGDRLILEYVETISVHTDPQATFDRYSIDQVLYPTDSVLGRWLDKQAGWMRAFADETGAVWVRRDG